MSSAQRMNKRLLAIVIGIAGLLAAIWLWPSQASARPAALQSAPAACAPQPANLVSWWPLNGNASDIVGGRNGAINDNPAVVPGMVGDALAFDGANDYIAVADSPALNPGTGDFSVAAWIKTTATGTGVFIDKRQSSPYIGYEFLVYSGRLSVQLADGDYTIYNSPVSAPLVNDGQWHYVAMTVDRDNAAGLKLYTDGQVVATFDPRGRAGSINTGADLRIGAHALSSSAYFAGSMDEVDFYNRALDAAEVQGIFQAGSAGKCTVTPPTAVPTTPPTNTATTRPTTPPTTPPTATTPPTNTPTPSPTHIVPTNTPVPSVTPGPAQQFRDVGLVRVWADSFSDAGGVTTASGNVVIGPKSAGSNGRYFKISASASWSLNTPLNLSGQFGLLGGLNAPGGTGLLGQGAFKVNRDTGVLSWEPGAQVLYKKVGSSALTITPTLTINVLQPEVAASALIVLALPEAQEVRTNAEFKLNAQGVVSGGATTSINLKMAGGTLVGSVRVDEQGLTAQQIQYTLPGLGAITLQDLVIDGKGPAKFRFGAATTFPVPNLDLGNGVFVLSNLQATLGLTYTSSNTVEYVVGLKGKLKLTNLPQNGTVEVDTFDVRIADGVVEGSVTELNVQIAGKKLSMKKASFRQKVFVARNADGQPVGRPTYRYELFSKETEWDVPSSWTGPIAAKVSLKDVVLQTEAPYIQIGTAGASFSSDKAFYLGGDANSNASVRFDQLSGSFKYNVTQKTWAAELNARVTFKFGQDSVEVSGVKLVVDNGAVSGTISNVTLKVAGLSLTAATLAYQNDVFTAGTVTLKLPAAWGNNSVTVTGLEISKNGVRIGGASGSFAIPDQTIGDVLKLSGMSASVSIDAQRNYSLTIAATIQISKVNSSAGSNGVSISGSLKIANGKVDGTISAFSFKLVGLEFAVSNARFVDNKITADVVSLKLPATLGSAQTTIYGLEIGGGDGFRIQGGTFRLPDFTMGGVGVQNVQAEINRQPDGTYSVGAGAKLNLQTFSVEGRFRIAYNPANNGISLKHVYLSYEGQIPHSAIPLGNTGFFITKIWGQFDMDNGSMSLAFGVRASMAFQVAGKSLVGIEGAVAIQLKPSFEFRSSANASLLGYEVASVNLRITRTSFEFQAELHAGIIHASLEIAFGKDAANEFTFYGKAQMDLMIPRGTFVNKRLIKIPNKDWRLFSMMLDAGKFTHNGSKVWGGRLSGRLLGFSYFIFAQFSPGQKIDVGTRMSEYVPVRPALNRSHPALASGEALYEISVGRPTSQLTIVEAAPEGSPLPAAKLKITGPNNVQFVQTLIYTQDDSLQRIYTLDIANPAAAVGTWTVITQEGNEIAVFGAIPAPAIGSFSACTAANTCLQPAAPGAAPLTLAQGAPLTVAWQTSHVTDGLDLEIYATAQNGTRYPIAEGHTDATALNGSKQWSPILPNGAYTLTLSLSDRMNAVSTASKSPLLIVDNGAPSAPAGLTATARADGSVALAWNGAAAAADVIGYRIAVNGGEPQIVEQRLSAYDVFGLAPGSANQITLAAYDINDNVGPASTVSVSIPSVGVSASWPARDSHTQLINDVGVTFNQPVVVEQFTVSRGGVAVPGSVAPITSARSTTASVVIGARFVPSSTFLAVGEYVATARVRLAGSADTFEVSWPFSAVAPTNVVHLPMVRR